MIITNLKSILAYKKMTLRELQKKTGISINLLSKLANNNVGISTKTLDLICKALEIKDFNLLLTFIDDREDLSEDEKKNKLVA